MIVRARKLSSTIIGRLTRASIRISLADIGTSRIDTDVKGQRSKPAVLPKMASKFPLPEESLHQYRVLVGSLDVHRALREHLIVRIESSDVNVKELGILSILRYENVTFEQLRGMLLDAHRLDLVYVVNQYLSERESVQAHVHGQSESEHAGISPTIDGINPDFLRRHSTDECLRQQVLDVDNSKVGSWPVTCLPASHPGNGNSVTSMPWSLPFQAVGISTRSPNSCFLPVPEQRYLSVAEVVHEFQEREREVEKDSKELVHLRKEVKFLKQQQMQKSKELVRLRNEVKFFKQHQMQSSSSSSSNNSDDVKMMEKNFPHDTLSSSSSSSNNSDDEKMMEKNFPHDTLILSESSSGKDGGESSSDSSESME